MTITTTPSRDGLTLDLRPEPAEPPAPRNNTVAERLAYLRDLDAYLGDLGPDERATLNGKTYDIVNARALIAGWISFEQRVAQAQASNEAAAVNPARLSRPWIPDAEYRQLQRGDVPMRLRVLSAVVAHALGEDMQEAEDTGMTARELRKAVPGRSADVEAARDALLAEGLLEYRPGRGGAQALWPQGFVLSSEPEAATGMLRRA